jgi:ABC-2 type transport system ATP-binding protein
MPAVIETQSLTKSYGAYRGIVDVDLIVNQGEIFGFLGPNGAGKTTAIRILLDLIRATSGTARVFGIESSADPVTIHRRLGYLPGEWNLYDRLSGWETIRYFANLRGGLDRAYVDELVQRLDLDPSRRFREYSKGNKQKIGLICALQHRPELLILDEPTSGLDPLVQQTFNELLFEGRGEGRTVFLSSHIISEVERTCDRVAIIREGRIVRTDTLEGVRSIAAHEVELRFASPVDAAPFGRIEGVANLAAEGHILRMLVTGPIAPVVRLAGQYDLVDFVSREPSLEEVFLAEYAPTTATVAKNGETPSTPAGMAR